MKNSVKAGAVTSGTGSTGNSAQKMHDFLEHEAAGDEASSKSSPYSVGEPFNTFKTRMKRENAQNEEMDKYEENHHKNARKQPQRVTRMQENNVVRLIVTISQAKTLPI